MSARGSLPLVGAIPEPSGRPRWAVAAKGFRPFFLLASAFAVLVVPTWLLVLGGVLRTNAYLDATTWHAHEMVFGFAVAVIAGFLLTAVGNWTQRETAVGAPLVALSALWVLGRIAMATAGLLPRGVPAFADLAFLPALGWTLARPLVAARSRRNFIMLAVLGALFAANVAVHLEALGVVGVGSARHACVVGVDILVLVILIIAGRVFPMFTRNATGVESIRSVPALDVLTIGGMAALTLLDVFALESGATAALSGVVGVLAALRAIHWGARRSVHHPLLWILHAGYAWIPFGLLLRAVAGFDAAVPRSLATHALTVGAIGSLTLGMMARVALGHTGRPLVVARPVALAFGAISAAGIARTIVPLLVPAWYFPTLVTAGALWSIAFLVFVVVHAPLLSRRRMDGKAG